jgi:hypothetical protein
MLILDRKLKNIKNYIFVSDKKIRVKDDIDKYIKLEEEYKKSISDKTISKVKKENIKNKFLELRDKLKNFIV